MVIVKALGATFAADIIEQTPGGDYLVRARAHTGRTAPGTLVLVKKNEIAEMAAAEQPAAPIDPKSGLSALESAMAEELKTLPKPAELIAKAQEVKTPPGRPTQPRGTGPHPHQTQAGQHI